MEEGFLFARMRTPALGVVFDSAGRSWSPGRGWPTEPGAHAI